MKTWEQRKLGEVAQEFKSGNSLKADEIDITGDYPVYGGNGLRGYTSTYNHDGEYALIGRQGALCGNMNYSVGKAYFTEHAVVVKADENNDTRFLYYMLDTMNLGQYSDQSAQPGLAVNKLVKLENQFPMKEEQQRIGWYFSNIDHLITLHQRKCEETKSLKKYMLQKMFPENGNCVPKIRFSGFADAWEQRKWIDVVDISTEMVNPTTGEYDNMPHIAPGNIESFTGRILDNVKTVKEEQLISGKFRFRPDDVVYGKINPQLGKYFYATVNGLTSADAYVFNGKNGLKQKFLFALLQTSDFFKYSVSVSKRSGMPKINRDELNAYSFLMPSEEEQDRIGSYLLQLDHLITLHQHKLFCAKNVMKYITTDINTPKKEAIMAELESVIEQKLIEQLIYGDSQWTYREDLKTEADLWKNFRYILEQNNKERLNGEPLSDAEFEQVKNQLQFSSFYKAGEWLVGENGKVMVHVQRDTER